MSFCFILKSILFLGYFAVVYYIVNLVIKNQERYYAQKYCEKDGKKVSLHDVFDVFARRDKPAIFWKLYLKMLFIGFPKFIVGMTFAVILAFTLKIKTKGKDKFTKEEIQEIKKITSFWMSLVIRLGGIAIKKKRLPDEIVLPVFQKYFGSEYKIDYYGKFSCYISNHTSFLDILIGMALYGAGFVGKKSVKNVPIFGDIGIGIGSIFVDREQGDSRKNALEMITERQKQFYEGENVMPIVIFPEGTTSSGRHLLPFKKGAFYSLLPIKASICHPNIDEFLHAGCGASEVAFNFFRNISELYNPIEYIELPILAPNDYLFENFSKFGKEKWEIYAEATREIMCQLGDFEKSDMGLRDSFRYEKCLEEEKFIEKEKFKRD